MIMKNKNGLILAAMAFSLLTTGCADTSDQNNSSGQPDTQSTDEETENSTLSVEELPAAELSQTDAPYSFDASALFSDRDLSNSYEETATITLNGDSAEISGEGAETEGSVITIKDEGVYRITGTLLDGQIIVNSGDKVQLVLDNASISCSDSSAIYVENAKKTFLTLAEGTENTISDGSVYPANTDTNNEPDAAIFSKDSLTINGTGHLTVNGNYNEGITSKDDLVICSADVTVHAVGNGLKGKDYVAVTDADLTIDAGGDGIKASNTAPGTGYIYFSDGSCAIEAEGDGIQAENELAIEGATLTVIAGGGTVNAEPHTDSFGGFGRNNWWNDNAEDTTDAADETAISVKGIKAGSLLYIGGGVLDVESADDTLHTNGDFLMTGGSVTVRAGSKGIHADGAVGISEGDVQITESYEGVEAAAIQISGGNVSINSSDDGFNASDGTMQGAAGGAVDCMLEISGGHVYVNAEGDGLDSNGELTISGGTVLVDGSVNGGNGALDSNGGIHCTGGELIAAGSSGMAEYPENGQNTIVLTTDSQKSGTVVSILDSDGNEVLSHSPAKQWNSLVVSSDVLQDGETYSILLDGTEEGSVTLNDAVTFLGEANGFGRQMPDGQMHGGGKPDGQLPGGGKPDGQMHGGQRPDDGERPEMPSDFIPGEMPVDEQWERR